MIEDWQKSAADLRAAGYTHQGDIDEGNLTALILDPRYENHVAGACGLACNQGSDTKRGLWAPPATFTPSN